MDSYLKFISDVQIEDTAQTKRKWKDLFLTHLRSLRGPGQASQESQVT